VQVRPDGTSDATDATYGFANTNNIGLSFEVEFQDASGKSIGKGTYVIAG